MKKFFKYLQQDRFLNYSFFIVAGLIIYCQLFVTPMVGVADNNDFRRISKQVGIEPSADQTSVFKYFELQYEFGTTQKINYLSSELIFIFIAKKLNTIFYSQEIFNIRFLGFIHTIFYLIALYLFVKKIEYRTWIKIVFLLLLLFMFLDVRITSYFNSFYSESASIIFLFFMLAAAFSIKIENISKKSKYLEIIIFSIFSLLLIFSKAQNIVLIIPISIFFVLFTWNWIQSFKNRLLLVIEIIILTVFIVWWVTYSGIYSETKYTNIRVIIEDEIKIHSPDVENDLNQLGIVNDDISNISYSDIIYFYISNPNRYIQLIERRSKKAFSHIPFGNYSKHDSTEPGQQSSKFNVWWAIKNQFYPKLIWFVLGIPFIGIIIGGYFFINGREEIHAKSGLILSMLSFMAILTFLVSSTFEANGPEKHLFLFNVIFDLITLLILFLFITRLTRSSIPSEASLVSQK